MLVYSTNLLFFFARLIGFITSFRLNVHVIVFVAVSVLSPNVSCHLQSLARSGRE